MIVPPPCDGKINKSLLMIQLVSMLYLSCHASAKKCISIPAILGEERWLLDSAKSSKSKLSECEYVLSDCAVHAWKNESGMMGEPGTER